MAESKSQSFANHARYDPIFHFFVIPVAIINAGVDIAGLVRHPSLASGWSVVVAVAAVIAVFKIRIYALKVQDRVIRLEERLRLSQVLPESSRAGIAGLSESQLIAIRFACDEEAPALVEKTLSGNLKNSEIKKLIGVWRPDYFRV